MKPQAFVIALITITVMLIGEAVTRHTQSGALRDLIESLSFWAFIPFGLAVGAAATRSNALLVATSVIVTLIVAPRGLQQLSKAVAPLGGGIVIGIFISKALKEESLDRSSA